MSWLYNLNFRWKLTLPVALLLSIALIGLQQVNRLGANVNQLADEYLPGVDFLLQADRDLYQALVAMHDENIAQARDRAGKYFQTTSSASASAGVPRST